MYLVLQLFTQEEGDQWGMLFLLFTLRIMCVTASILRVLHFKEEYLEYQQSMTCEAGYDIQGLVLSREDFIFPSLK